MNKDHSSAFPPEYGFNNQTQSESHQLNDANDLVKERESGIKLVAYGGSYAFQCQQARTVAGWHTIQFESAPKNHTSPTDRTFNWSQKIAFQITDSELPMLIAVLFGFLPAIRFDLHGPEKNKWLEIVNQGNRMFFRAGMKGSPHVAPVSLIEASMFGLLALNQYTANFPLLNSDSVLASVKILARQSFEAKTYKVPKAPQKSDAQHSA